MPPTRHGLFEEFQLGSFPQPARSIQGQFSLHSPEVTPEGPDMTLKYICLAWLRSKTRAELLEEHLAASVAEVGPLGH